MSDSNQSLTVAESNLQPHSIQEPDAASVLQAAIDKANAPAVEPEAVVPEAEKKEEVSSPKDDKFASKFAALSRKEKQIRQQQQQIEAMRIELEKQRTEEANRWKPYETLKERLQKNPLEALQELGLSYKDLTERFLLQGEEPVEKKQDNIMENLKQEIEALKAERLREKEEAQKDQAELQKKAEERAKQNYLEHLTKFVNDNSEYELIRTNDAVELVFDVMDQLYQERGEIPPEKEAADAVEAYLLEEAKKLVQSSKIKGLLAPQNPAPEPKKSQSATLSNTVAQQVPTAGERFLSDDESKRQIASMLKWTD